MAFQVDISPSALNDAEAAFLWIRKESPSYAEEWFNGLLEAINSLENFPNRCPLAPESEELGIEIRQLLYRKNRILFSIAPSRETVDGTVQILRIRHQAQERLKLQDLL
ncbi:MAG: type II toxin-antitoxin system RelE/ParE family toxin [Chroococcidiopsidaceae cyanobacterium CP_BM_ER_R8_30]|nr:type II toxin-antitoxin system RelE/ParE family toxin [Chroococcidiopsidaceae cyanobacterium CP_BM_ER_R8_30]